MAIQEVLDCVVNSVELFSTMLERFEPNKLSFPLGEVNAVDLSAVSSVPETNQSNYLWDKVTLSLEYITAALRGALPVLPVVAEAEASRLYFMNEDAKIDFELSLQFLDGAAKSVAKQYDFVKRCLSRIPSNDSRAVLEKSLDDTYFLLLSAYSTINRGIEIINEHDPTVHFDKISIPK